MNNQILKHIVEYTTDELIKLSHNSDQEIIPEYYRNKEKDLPREIWRELSKNVMYKNIQHINKIEASNLGRIRFNEKDIANQKDYNNNGNLTLSACNNELVHRLVAEAWLKKDEDSKDLEVHHINNNGYDNRLENLIWIKPELHKKATSRREIN